MQEKVKYYTILSKYMLKYARIYTFEFVPNRSRAARPRPRIPPHIRSSHSPPVGGEYRLYVYAWYSCSNSLQHSQVALVILTTRPLAAARCVAGASALVSAGVKRVTTAMPHTGQTVLIILLTNPFFYLSLTN